MIDTILVPVDGSAVSRKAVDFASELAARYDARIILLHILLRQNLAEGLHGLSEIERRSGGGLEALGKALGDLPLKKAMASARGGDSVPREVLDFIAREVVGYAEKVARSKGVVNIKTVVEDGDPAKRILETAEKENADTIIMGARGLSDVEGILLGSVSHKISHLASCTVITVR